LITQHDRIEDEIATLIHKLTESGPFPHDLSNNILLILKNEENGVADTGCVFQCSVNQ
jgi:hypothetical protein